MKLKIFVGVFVLTIIWVIYYFFPMKISDEKVKIECNYMAYACGDCYPQYRVNKILQGGIKEVDKILNTELMVEFEDKKTEQEMDKNTAKCVICYNFTFEGDLKYSKNKGTYFIAQTVNYQIEDDSCCNK